MQKLVILLFALAVAALGQTSPAPASVPGLPMSTSLNTLTLPTYIMAGGSCNQFSGCSGFLAGIIPETNKAGGFYASITADLTVVNITDPVTKKTGYGLSPNVRAGERKVVFNDGKNMITVGGDLGASWSQPSGVASSGLTVGLAGSFTIAYFRQLSSTWAIGVPVRMLWLSGIGPGGTGVWNPVVGAGIVWKPGK